MAHRITLELGARSYEVVIGHGLNSDLTNALAALAPPSILLVTDENVGKLHGARIEALLAAIAPVKCATIPAGENSKSLAQFEMLCEKALTAPSIERTSAVVALGGGLVGDLAGFAAATLLRGIPCIQVPTSLLAMVDSSIGGKTAVNHRSGKNLIGAFWQPRAVICDLDFLGSLPAREYFSALAEIVKYAWIGGELTLDELEAHKERIKARTLGPLEQVVAACARHKARIVSTDEYERSGERALLNFGHSVAHVLEAQYPERFLHGEAVSIGLVAAARVSRAIAGLDPHSVGRLERLLSAFKLPVSIPSELTASELIAGLRSDKKRAAGKLNFVVSPKPGRAMIMALDVDARLADIILGRQ